MLVRLKSLSKLLMSISNYLWWLGRVSISSTLFWWWLRAAKISLAPFNRITFYSGTGSFSLKLYRFSIYRVREFIDLNNFAIQS